MVEEKSSVHELTESSRVTREGKLFLSCLTLQCASQIVFHSKEIFVEPLMRQFPPPRHLSHVSEQEKGKN